MLFNKILKSIGNKHKEDSKTTNGREVGIMSEREKEILKTLTDAIGKMDDFEKGRFLGRAEAMADVQETERVKASAVAS